MIKKNKSITTFIFISIIISYILFNILLLTKYPFIHSDESWLSGLSRTVMDKQTFNTSEPFFDLYPRAIHGLRVIFISLQILFIKVFGYTIFSVRLLSFTFGVLSLVFIYKSLKHITENVLYSFIGTLTIGINIQFIMSSHTARQETIILFGMVLSFYLVLTEIKNKSFIVGSIIGLLIGVHPNSFIVACGISFIFIYSYITKRIKFKDLIIFITTLSVWALTFIGISLIINNHFISDYLAFGESLGVLNDSVTKYQGFINYYYKLFNQIGGTYNLVYIRFDLLIALISTMSGLVLIAINLFKKTSRSTNSVSFLFPTLMILGINLAYIIIGRYNQTAVIFTITFAYINVFVLAKYMISKLNIKEVYFRSAMSFIIILALLSYNFNNSFNIISNTTYEDYDLVGERIRKTVPPDAKVLANLNMDYHFDNYMLFDYRNLDFLDQNHMSFSDYIAMNDISYIVLYEEMKYIYESKPKWDILYGDLSYYEDMVSYINDNCIIVDEFENPTYGMRISKYVDVYPWYTKIYKVKK